MTHHKCNPCTHCGKCKNVAKSFPALDEKEGLSAGKKPEEFDKEQLAVGVGVEMEHTNNPKTAQKIAMDHLTEDPKYYIKLNKMENAEKSITFSFIKNRPTVRKIDFQGISISVEVDKGSYLEWHDPFENRSGRTKMHYPYGYIQRTVGADGDGIDVFVGPEKDSKKVFVVQQNKGGRSHFTKFDEDKVMLGFTSEREAKAAYLVHYDNTKYFGGMSETDIDTFKRVWMQKSLNTIQPAQQPTQPGMQPPMGMMQMGPPPIDVETYEGVSALLGRLGSIKDTELMTIAEKIWGGGYNFEGASPAQAHSEILGFLLDQRNLLCTIQPQEIDLNIAQQPQTGLGLTA